MPSEHNEDDHIRRLHDFFNPIPNANPRQSIATTSAGGQYAAPAQPPPPKQTPKILSLFLKGIIMALIISLFLLFLGIAAVALLHFVIVGGALHQHRSRRLSSSSRSRSDSTMDAYSAEELRRFLPSFKYVGARLHRTAAQDCAICLDCFKDGDWACSLPDCSHTFHSNCVGKWLTKSANCPICRGRVRLSSEAADWAIASFSGEFLFR